MELSGFSAGETVPKVFRFPWYFQRAARAPPFLPAEAETVEAAAVGNDLGQHVDGALVLEDLVQLDLGKDRAVFDFRTEGLDLVAAERLSPAQGKQFFQQIFLRSGTHR